MRIKRKIAILLSLIMSASVFFANADEGVKLKEIPKLSVTSYNLEYGLNNYKPQVKTFSAFSLGEDEESEIPEEFRKQYNSDPKNVIGSPVRDQGNNNTCWTFSNVKALENRLLKDNKDIDYNYSESHVAHSSSYETDGKSTNPYGFKKKLQEGGNFSMAMSYFARGSGPVLEKNDPYPKNEMIVGRNFNETNSKYPEKYVTNMYQIENNVIDLADLEKDAGDNAREEIVLKIKELTYKYGGVNQGIYYTPVNFNSARTALYYPSTLPVSEKFVPPNHAVCIVGWDDYYEKENFKEGRRPTKNGAFLVANSYGNNSNDNGYFWLSYYDKYIGVDCGAIAEVKNQDEFDKLYQYDMFAPNAGYGYNGDDLDIYGTNVFHNAEYGEILKAVSFYTMHENLNYSIYFDNGGINFEGIKPIEPIKSGSLRYAGFHTIDIPKQIITDPNGDFYITVKLGYKNTKGEPIDYVFPISNPVGSVPDYAPEDKEGYICYLPLYEFADDALNVKFNPNDPEHVEIITNAFFVYFKRDNYTLNIKAHTDRSEAKVSLRNQNDEKAISISVGENISVKVRLNDIEAEQPYIALCLLKNSKIENIVYKPVTEENQTFSMAIPEGSGYTLNTMLIDADNLKPLLFEKVSLN